MQCSVKQCSAIQCSTVQCSALHHNVFTPTNFTLVARLEVARAKQWPRLWFKVHCSVYCWQPLRGKESNYIWSCESFMKKVEGETKYMLRQRFQTALGNKIASINIQCSPTWGFTIGFTWPILKGMDTNDLVEIVILRYNHWPNFFLMSLV